MRVLRELVGMPLRENVMNLIDEFYDITRQCYPQLNLPERPLMPPEPKEVSLVLAEKRLRHSLKTKLHQSPYFDDFVRILREEMTDDEADQVAANLITGRISNISPVGFVMNAVRERAYRVCAELYIDELGVE